MHEQDFCSKLWQTVLDKVQEQNLTKIVKITIVLGQACGVNKKALNEIFVNEYVLKNKISQNAQLEIQTETLLVKCNKCGNTIDASSMRTMFCPHCGSGDIIILSGNDCYVRAII